MTNMGAWGTTARLALVVAAGAATLTSAGSAPYHSADTSGDFGIALNELVRVVQFYNAGSLGCLEGTEDGYAPNAAEQTCDYHSSDFATSDWTISLSELLRAIQLFSVKAYGINEESEDGFAPLLAPKAPTNLVVRGFQDSQQGLDAIPDAQVGGETRRDWQELLGTAEEEVAAGNPCAAADFLQVLHLEVSALRGLQQGGKGADPGADGLLAFYSRVRALQFDLLTGLPEEFQCFGFERAGMGEETEVLDQSTAVCDGSVRFGMPRLLARNRVTPDGLKLFGQIYIPELEAEVESPGLPALPHVRKIIAVPPGATLEVDELVTVAETFSFRLGPAVVQPYDFLNTFPFPPAAGPNAAIPGELLWSERPFAVDESVYESAAAYPPQACRLNPLGQARGLDLYQLEIAAGSYNPVEEELTLYESVEFFVRFEDGADGFREAQFDTPFERTYDFQLGGLLNAEGVQAAPFLPAPGLSEVGEELLILSAGVLMPAAEKLADWKREKGIITSIVEVGSGVPSLNSAEEIDAFIESRYATSKIKPAYVLIMGDSNLVPPNMRTTLANDPDDRLSIGTDWPYAVLGPALDDTTLPTFAVGRITSRNIEAAINVVDKIIAYEKTPPGTPGADDFYNRMTFAGEFECCAPEGPEGTDKRPYIEALEFARGKLVPLGYDIDRFYFETIQTPCNGCTIPEGAYLGDPAPRYFWNGTAVPEDIGPESGFRWDADTQDVVRAFNEGRFLMLHRDHGFPGGWAEPRFTLEQLPMTNGAFLPVLFSVNCSTGLWDNEVLEKEGAVATGRYFSEVLLDQSGGGAVGIISALRVTPTWPNSVFAKGLMDALYPNVLPNFGSSKPLRRLGDILNHAKFYLATQVSNSEAYVWPSDLVNMHYLYHVIGDPTLEVWTRDPDLRAPVGGLALEGNTAINASLTYPNDGAIITATQEDGSGGFIPVGRGVVEGGAAHIDFFQPPTLGEAIRFSVNEENAIAKAFDIVVPEFF